jgi:hypothetical protein
MHNTPGGVIFKEWSNVPRIRDRCIPYCSPSQGARTRSRSAGARKTGAVGSYETYKDQIQLSKSHNLEGAVAVAPLIEGICTVGPYTSIAQNAQPILHGLSPASTIAIQLKTSTMRRCSSSDKSKGCPHVSIDQLSPHQNTFCDPHSFPIASPCLPVIKLSSLIPTHKELHLSATRN